MRLGELVNERRRAMSLSISAAARAAGIDRGTWTGIEKGTRETVEYNFARIERVLGWQPGTIDRIMDGEDPGEGTEPEEVRWVGSDLSPDDIALEIEMIQKSQLPETIKRAMIREVGNLRDRQLQERENLPEKQAAERREQVKTWLRLSGDAPATT